MGDTSEHGRLTPRLAWLLAAPHTWCASIFPVLLAVAFAAARGHTVSCVAALVLLAISILMQSAVNAINDYFDFKKGADSAEDNVEVDDAVLVYNDIDPKSVRNLAIGFMVAAFVLGIYCIWLAGWVPLAIAVIGAVVVFLYSGGRTPISYLPIGELVSGFVMGGLITLASYAVLTRTIEWLVLLWSLPLIIGIALIMFTNNTCDIEKDLTAKRRTLSVVLGRKKSVKLYRALVVIWYASCIAIVGIWFTPGIIVAPFMILATYPLAKALFSNPLVPESRIAGMSQICGMNIAMGAFYAVMVVFSKLVLVL